MSLDAYTHDPDPDTQRLRVAVCHAMDNPGEIVDTRPGEAHVSWIARAVAITAMSEHAAREVLGDLANWKPTGFLNPPPQVGHRPDDAPPALTVVPEGLAAPLQTAEPPDGVTDCRTGTTIPPITATPIWERSPNWADNLGICTKEIGHPDLHGNGPETTERHRCDAIYHLDGLLAGIPATKAAMAANIRSAITAEDTLEDGYNTPDWEQEGKP